MSLVSLFNLEMIQTLALTNQFNVLDFTELEGDLIDIRDLQDWKKRVRLNNKSSWTHSPELVDIELQNEKEETVLGLKYDFNLSTEDKPIYGLYWHESRPQPYLINGVIQIKQNNLPRIAIPFFDQESRFCKLIKHYGQHYIDILNMYIGNINMPIVFNGFENIQSKFNVFNDKVPYEQFVGEIVHRSNLIRPFSLCHLKAKEIVLDENGIVNLICSSDSEFKYTPPHVKVIFSPKPETITEALEKKKEFSQEDIDQLFHFAPYGFVAPCFGEY